MMRWHLLRHDQTQRPSTPQTATQPHMRAPVMRSNTMYQYMDAVQAALLPSQLTFLQKSLVIEDSNAVEHHQH
jgi:hypothetical protein